MNSTNNLMLQHDQCGAGYTLDQLTGSARAVILDRTVTPYCRSTGQIVLMAMPLRLADTNHLPAELW